MNAQLFTRFFFAVAIFLLSPTFVSATLLTNGSLTGPIASGSVPTGWDILIRSPDTATRSPDTMDQDNNLGGAFGGFGATPSASPDGGTWVGMGVVPGSPVFIEAFGQTVTGLDVGATYAVSWYQANFGYTPLGYVEPDKIGLFVDGNLVGQGSEAALAPGWTSETVAFVATSTAHEISFSPGGTVGSSYLSIDGISMTRVIPEPTTVVIWALLGGIVLIARHGRRRRKVAFVVAR